MSSFWIAQTMTHIPSPTLNPAKSEQSSPGINTTLLDPILSG
jgi:hypothetical protein